jgi:two-component system NtrC family sensor kinase
VHGGAAPLLFGLPALSVAVMSGLTLRPARGEVPSLRTELLFNLAFLAGGALVLAVTSAVLAPLLMTGGLGSLLLAGLILIDIVIFVAFGRYLIQRLVTGPMDALVETTQAVAEGRLSRRAAPGGTREFDRLAASVNRMTERLLVRAEKLASVGQLAAGVAHEIGNPLSAIGNYVEVLRRRGADPDLVAAVVRETERIDRIVRTLLAYAAPREARPEPLDVAAVVADVVALLEAQGALRPVTVACEAEAGLPRVRGDRSAMEQVFVNLLLNAVDAAGPGGRVRVRAAVVRRGPAGVARSLSGVPDDAPAVAVTVEDDGPGVADALRDKVFDPFFTTKDPGKGTGLGLAIVQRIVHDHGGRVDVESGPLGGAALTVTLPVETAG